MRSVVCLPFRIFCVCFDGINFIRFLFLYRLFINIALLLLFRSHPSFSLSLATRSIHKHIDDFQWLRQKPSLLFVCVLHMRRPYFDNERFHFQREFSHSSDRSFDLVFWLLVFHAHRGIDSQASRSHISVTFSG